SIVSAFLASGRSRVMVVTPSSLVVVRITPATLLTARNWLILPMAVTNPTPREMAAVVRAPGGRPYDERGVHARCSSTCARAGGHEGRSARGRLPALSFGGRRPRPSHRSPCALQRSSPHHTRRRRGTQSPDVGRVGADRDPGRAGRHPSKAGVGHGLGSG